MFTSRQLCRLTLGTMLIALVGCDQAEQNCGGPVSELPFSACGGPTSQPPSLGDGGGGPSTGGTGTGGENSGANNGGPVGENTGSSGLPDGGAAGGDAGVSPLPGGEVILPDAVDGAEFVTDPGFSLVAELCGVLAVCGDARVAQQGTLEGFEGGSLQMLTASAEWLQLDADYLVVKVRGQDAGGTPVGIVVVIQSSTGDSWLAPDAYGPGPAQVEECGVAPVREVQASVRIDSLSAEAGFAGTLFLSGDGWTSEVELDVPALCDAR